MCECKKWLYSESLHRQMLQLKNREWCWLYPKEKLKELNRMVPNFEHCDTVYTKCDYILEEQTNNKLLKLEAELKRHADALALEIGVQQKLIYPMWVHTQRFMLLKRSGVCFKAYPEIVSANIEKYEECEFQRKLLKINNSNCRISHSFDAVREALFEMDRKRIQLDYTVNSPFIKGDCRRRPLEYYYKVFTDVYKYFYETLANLKSWAQCLELEKPASVEDYMAVIKQDKTGEKCMIYDLMCCEVS